MNHLVPCHLTFSGLAKRFSHLFSRYPSYSGSLFGQWCHRFCYYRQFCSCIHHEVNVLVPAFKVAMGSRGPDISEPWQPYLISKSASPTTEGASSSFLALGHSFFQRPKAHWFGCNGAGPPLGPVEGLSCPWGRGGFLEGQDRLFQSSS